jgi:hypothetical protein
MILVAPIIELDDDEELIVEVDGYETNGNQELKSSSKQPAKKKQSHKMNFSERLQQVEMTDIAAKHELNISCTSLASDTDFRDNSTKQAENVHSVFWSGNRQKYVHILVYSKEASIYRKTIVE